MPKLKGDRKGNLPAMFTRDHVRPHFRHYKITTELRALLNKG